MWDDGYPHRENDARSAFYAERAPSVTVNEDWRVPLPPQIAAVIENVELGVDGPGTFWHVDRAEGFLVLAPVPIDDSRYGTGPLVEVLNRTPDDEFHPAAATGYVRPKTDFHDEIVDYLDIDPFARHTELVYLVREWMYESDPQRVYLLPRDEFMELVDGLGFGFGGRPTLETVAELLETIPEGEFVTPAEEPDQ